MSEDWNPDKVAAECKAAADKKTRARRAPPPPKGAAPLPPETAAPTKPKRGRKTKYKAKYCARVEKWARMGATVVEMADWLGVATSTFFLWRHEHQAFADAVKLGHDDCNDRVERSLYDRANGYDYHEQQAIKVRDADGAERVEIVELRKHQPSDPNCTQFFLVNRRPDLWRFKRTIEHQGQVEHLSVDQQRKELADFLRRPGSELIAGAVEGSFTDVTPALEAPKREEPEAATPGSP